jgi:hypothetical protein
VRDLHICVFILCGQGLRLNKVLSGTWISFLVLLPQYIYTVPPLIPAHRPIVPYTHKQLTLRHYIWYQGIKTQLPLPFRAGVYLPIAIVRILELQTSSKLTQITRDRNVASQTFLVTIKEVSVFSGTLTWLSP